MWRPIKAWIRVLKAAELRYIRIHDLRHTNASLAAAAGVPIQVVQKRLGHSQIQTTMRYAHLYDDPVRQSSEMISSAINNLTNPDSKVAEFPKLKVVA